MRLTAADRLYVWLERFPELHWYIGRFVIMRCFRHQPSENGRVCDRCGESL